MSLEVLPPVAKSFNTFCKKCDADRYHRVLAHTSETAAKIECEICKSKKTYSLKKAKAPSAKAAGSKAAKKPGTGRVKKNSHADEFGSLMLNRGTEKGTPFSMKSKFEADQKIDHPKFGAGFVKSVLPDRIDVMFEDEVKTLIHNKH